MFDEESQTERKPVTAQQVILIFAIFGAFVGMILASFVFLSPPRGRDPNYAPGFIGGCVSVVSIVVIILTMRSQRARSHREDVLKRGASGALNFSAGGFTEGLVNISSALKDRFQIQVETGDPLVDPARATLLDVTKLVLQILNSGNPGRLYVRREMLDRVQRVICDTAPCDMSQINHDLNKIVPRSERRLFWSRLQQTLSLRLPMLQPNGFARGAAGILAIGLTYAIVVPAAAWADAKHPLVEPPAAVQLAAAILVHGGFFVLLILFIALFVSIGRWLLPIFPPNCATATPISMMHHLNRIISGPEEPWTLEQVWSNVRDVVADVTNRPESSITQSSRLNDFR